MVVTGTNMYLELIKAYMDFNNVYDYEVVNILNHNPVIISIVERCPNGYKEEVADLICSVDNDFHVMNTKGMDCIEYAPKLNGFTDVEIEEQKEIYRNIIKKYM